VPSLVLLARLQGGGHFETLVPPASK
jgi:hypothetical protein